MVIDGKEMLLVSQVMEILIYYLVMLDVKGCDSSVLLQSFQISNWNYVSHYSSSPDLVASLVHFSVLCPLY